MRAVCRVITTYILSTILAASLVTYARAQRSAATPQRTGAHASPSAEPDLAPKPAMWLLAFAGKETSDLANDPRFRQFLRTHVTRLPLVYWGDTPSKPYQNALNLLLGPGDDVRVLEHRYVTGNACAPHDCVDAGLFWADAQTGITIFAKCSFAPSAMVSNTHLWLFTNAPMTAAELPATFAGAIYQWSTPADPKEGISVITQVSLVQPDGTQVEVAPANVYAWQPAAPSGR